MERVTKGRKAEEAACAYLQAEGFRILERNFRLSGGELDIIAEDNGTLVFVEVRSRRGLKYGLPQETVNYTKQQQVRKIAARYLKIKGAWARKCRFDVVGIIYNQKDEIQSVELISDAF